MYTLKQAAEKLDISVVTLRRYIKQGKLTAKKKGKEYLVYENDVEALRTVSTPTDPDAIIEEALNTNNNYRYEFQRADDFGKAEAIFRERGETDKANDIGKDRMIFGYRLIVQSRAEKSKKTNRGRFSPRATGTDGEGNPAAWPDPAWIDDKVVAYAKQRADTVKNPTTRAVYSDLVFEYSKNADRPLYGKKAAVDYLLAADIEPKDDESHRLFNVQSHILRALELALILKDDKLFDKAAHFAIVKMEELASDGRVRILHELIEELLKNSKRLDDSSIAKLSTLVDVASAKYFEDGNQYLGRSFVELKRLLPATKDSSDEKKRIQRELFDSYMKEALGKSSSGLVAAHFYSEALKIGNGVITKKEQAELRRKIEELNIQGEAEMQVHSFEITIKDEDIKNYVNSVLVDDIEKSLRRIGGLRGMIPSIDAAKKSAEDMLDKYPISQMVGSHSMQDGRVVSITPGSTELSEDHIISRLNEAIQTHGLFLNFLFDELKRRGLDAKTLSAYLSQRDFFNYETMPAVSEAIDNYFKGNYYSAVTVLLTQMEQILRLANRKLGIPTLRSVDSGEQRVIYLQEALVNLKEVFDAFSPDAYQFFCLVLWDKRGLGLRDTTAHGLLKFSPSANKNEANLLIQLLLILALFEYKERPDKNG